MSQNEVFSFDDATRIRRPSPDWRGGQGDSFVGASHHPAFSTGPAVEKIDLHGLVGERSLVTAALPLLSLVPSLANSLDHADVSGLRTQLVDEIERFNEALSRHGVSSEYAWMATYALCALLDETIQKTPWGQRCGWAQQSLSIRFRRNDWGGEGFFDNVDRLIRHPQQNQSLIELYYVCLSLGFEGKHGKAANGKAALDAYRNELFELIRRQREGCGRELSPRWEGLKPDGNKLMRAVPGWVLLAIVGTILVLAYGGFFFNLDSEPTRQQLAALQHENIKLAGPMPPEASKPFSSDEPFKSFSGDQNVEVADDNMRIRNSFSSGSAQLMPEFIPLFQKVARQLNSGRYAVLVTGHTDDVKIHNFKFADNWALSLARAKNVADILIASGVPPDKVQSKGKASDEPLFSNDTPEHRARNRRVEIELIR